MKISTRGRYALRVMIDLAQQESGRYIALKDIAERQGISVKYLESIVAALSKAGFLDGVRGKGGGYRLTRKPEAYTVGSILRLAEGPLSPVTCLDTCPNPCTRSADCKTLPMWQSFSRLVNGFFDEITLAELLLEPSEQAKRFGAVSMERS